MVHSVVAGGIDGAWSIPIDPAWRTGLRRETKGHARAYPFPVFVALYFLVVSGPIGYARYRLPMEPTLIVLLVAGLAGSGLLDRLEGAVKRLRHPER